MAEVLVLVLVELNPDGNGVHKDHPGGADRGACPR
jgi:hypothetical protein